MIGIEYNVNLGYVKAEGHAGHGRKGEDVVCAGVSALLHMLGAQALKKAGGIAEDDGETMTIQGHGFRYSAVLLAVVDELEEMQKKYPENVRVRERS